MLLFRCVDLVFLIQFYSDLLIEFSSCPSAKLLGRVEADGVRIQSSVIPSIESSPFLAATILSLEQDPIYVGICPVSQFSANSIQLSAVCPVL